MSDAVKKEVDKDDPDKGTPIPECVAKANIERAPKGYVIACGVVSATPGGEIGDRTLTLVYQLEGKEIRARKLGPNVAKWNDRSIRDLVAATLALPASDAQFVSIIWE